MVTISKTRRYTELNYRLKKLNQLYSVMSELRLHTNTAVDEDTAKYYNNRLYIDGDYGSFLTASLESMRQVFYIELDGFIGCYWDENNRVVRKRNHESGSLERYLYDGTRSERKKTAQIAFEALLKSKANELRMIHDARGALGHFKELKERGRSFIPNDIDTREILDRLAEVIYLLGYQRWNKPDYIKTNNRYTQSTQRVIDKLVVGEIHANDIRWQYLKARSRWFGGKS